MLTEQTLLLHAATLLMGLHDGRSSSALAHGGCGIRVLLSSALAGIAGKEATLSVLVSGSRGISKHACCSPAQGGAAARQRPVLPSTYSCSWLSLATLLLRNIAYTLSIHIKSGGFLAYATLLIYRIIYFVKNITFPACF